MQKLISKKNLLTENGLALEYFPDYKRRIQQMHAIDTVLISIILKGTCRHYIDDIIYKEGPGDAGIIHYHQKHKLVPDGSIDHLNIYLDPKKIDFSIIPASLHSYLAGILPFEEGTVHNYNRIIHFRFPDLDKINQLLFFMNEEYKRKSRERNGLLMNYLSLITAEMVKGLNSEKQDFVVNTEEASRPLIDVISWLDEHYTEQISGDELAAMAGWSHSWLCRTFKQNVGMTIQDYIINKRITRAVFYILNTGQTMLSIAMEAGFNDVNFFNRKFKEVTGMTPGEYRKKNRTNQKHLA